MEHEEKAGFETGLDTSNDDVIGEDEWKALEQWYSDTHGFGNLDLVPFMPFLAEVRPGAFKRWRRLAEALGRAEGGGLPQAAVALFFLHYYTIIGNEKGILYEVLAAREWGATKGQVLDTIGYAFLTSGPNGMSAVADAAGDYLIGWDETEDAGRDSVWPEGWKSGTGAFATGLDFRDRDLSPSELDAVKAWHEETLGEVPHYVEFLAAYRPQVLKQLRNRYESALSGGLPDQLVPLLTLHAAAITGDEVGVRWGALTARRLGVTRDQVIETLCWSLPYGGVSRFDSATRAIADVVASMS